MRVVRHLLARRRLAVLIGVAALLLKLLVPAGYMVDGTRGHLAVVFCSGTGPADMAMTMPGTDAVGADHRAGHGRSSDHGKAEAPCAFSGLGAATVTPVDPVQLAALLAFVMAIGRGAPLPWVASRPSRLRPPLRAPPITL